MQLRRRAYLSSLWILQRLIRWEHHMLGWRNRRLYALQDVLPPLPVPRLCDTLRRLLDSARPALPPGDFDRTAALVAAVAAAGGEGERLQVALVRRAGECEGRGSWLEGWWEEEALLRSRDPLPIGGNWYGLDRPDVPTAPGLPEPGFGPQPARAQAARAARLLSGAMRFRRLLRKEQLEPLRMMGVVPLCMWQYHRIFHTYREPGPVQDRLVTATHPDDTRHVAVMRRGEIYTMDVCAADGRPLSIREMETQMQRIIDMSGDSAPAHVPPRHDPPAPGAGAGGGGGRAAGVGVLTSERRDVWARLRAELVAAGEGNAAALRAVETSALLLVLEDGPAPATERERARAMLMGDGGNRWFDKSIQVVVFEDGVAGVNCEQSWADAAVASHLFGFLHDYEDNVTRGDAPSPALGPGPV